MESVMELNFPKMDDRKVSGEFDRKFQGIQNWIAEGGEFPPEKNRYHLFVSLACPWCHKCVIVRKLKKLESIIGMTIVNPVREMHGRGWVYKEGPSLTKNSPDGLNNLMDLYLGSDPSYNARATVPVLFDTKKGVIVNNNDEEIVVMFDNHFDTLLPEEERVSLNLFPKNLEDVMKKMDDFLFENINDGVYRCGFATSQQAYEKSVIRLFKALDYLENRLSKHRYLFGDQIVGCDWRLFATLIRFDPVYYVLFKCNVRLIKQYKNMFQYMKDLYQVRGVKETVDFGHIKTHYYFTLKFINPYSIVAIGPDDQKLDEPHGREVLSKK